MAIRAFDSVRGRHSRLRRHHSRSGQISLLGEQGEFASTNVGGTRNVLEAGAASGCPAIRTHLDHRRRRQSQVWRAHHPKTPPAIRPMPTSDPSWKANRWRANITPNTACPLSSYGPARSMARGDIMRSTGCSLKTAQRAAAARPSRAACHVSHLCARLSRVIESALNNGQPARFITSAGRA